MGKRERMSGSAIGMGIMSSGEVGSNHSYDAHAIRITAKTISQIAADHIMHLKERTLWLICLLTCQVQLCYHWS